MTILARQTEVEQYKVIVLSVQRGQGEKAVLDPVSRITRIIQGTLNGFANHGVIFDEQYPHCFSPIAKALGKEGLCRGNACKKITQGSNQPL
ncbi:Ribosomal protein L10 [Pseudomonas syringae pv. actinidiae]|uniref:Ribosomal protein L10 n=1 Tax=Pseudomonas syringae pv. actinidiae TaxID=103796 RepID=A0A2V0QBX3_PSESF|nr:Ribosomal protein L10 [Pseudomonas syringae pv. actinidiae]